MLSLYVIRSKDPSGGMKDIVLSFSNLAKRTHLKKKSETGYASSNAAGLVSKRAMRFAYW